MLKKCCYEGVMPLSINKTLLCVRENRGLGIDGIVTANKGWERRERKRGMRTNYCKLKEQQALQPKPVLPGLMHWIGWALQTISSQSLQDRQLKMFLKYEYSQIFYYMPILLMQIWLLLLQPDFITFHSFSIYGFCRPMLTFEQVVTARHNTFVRNFWKYDFLIKVEIFFIVQNV